MNCPTCGYPLEQSVHYFGKKWWGFTRCLQCVPTGRWTPRGPVDIIWQPLGTWNPKPTSEL